MGGLGKKSGRDGQHPEMRCHEEAKNTGSSFYDSGQ